MEKQTFGKQMFAGPGRDNGTQSGLWSLGPVPPTTPRLYSFQRSPEIALVWEQAFYQRFFKAIRGKVSSPAFRVLLIVFSLKESPHLRDTEGGNLCSPRVCYQHVTTWNNWSSTPLGPLGDCAGHVPKSFPNHRVRGWGLYQALAEVCLGARGTLIPWHL